MDKEIKIKMKHINNLIDSFKEFHFYIVELCKENKLAFINWYILKPIAIIMVIGVSIIL
tara:strand:- start:198 stop:374 length:177 start_codon:yes stop_codon:yes gene_type:complete